MPADPGIALVVQYRARRGGRARYLASAPLAAVSVDVAVTPDRRGPASGAPRNVDLKRFAWAREQA